MGKGGGGGGTHMVLPPLQLLQEGKGLLVC